MNLVISNKTISEDIFDAVDELFLSFIAFLYKHHKILGYF